jgi:hypothetical protein
MSQIWRRQHAIMASLEKRYVDVWQAKQFGLKANVKLFFDGAATYFGIDGIDITEKQELRARILSGGPWSSDDRIAVIEYSEATYWHWSDC